MFKYFLYPLVLIDIYDLAFPRSLRVYFVLIGVWRDEKTVSWFFSSFPHNWVVQVCITHPWLFVLAFDRADHTSEVQVTMMLTESCKLRGLHHRWVTVLDAWRTCSIAKSAVSFSHYSIFISFSILILN